MRDQNCRAVSPVGQAISFLFFLCKQLHVAREKKTVLIRLEIDSARVVSDKARQIRRIRKKWRCAHILTKMYFLSIFGILGTEKFTLFVLLASRERAQYFIEFIELRWLASVLVLIAPIHMMPDKKWTFRNQFTHTKTPHN